MELFSILLLVLDVFAILDVLKSSKTNLFKALWIVGILVFPILGLLAWYFIGRK